MGLLRKLRQFGSEHILPLLDGRPPKGDEPVPPQDLEYGPLPQSFFKAVNVAREEAGYEALALKRDKHGLDRGMRSEFGAFDRSRRPSNGQQFDRSVRHGSPEQFRRLPPGTPIKFRRRPISPELIQPSASAPSLFGLQPHPVSPDMLREFQYAQQMSHVPRQQQHQQQFDMMPPPAASFYPQFQQPLYPMMYPNVNAQNWFMMSQYPRQMYPLY
ncbi:unnamed protein product [Adineta ricciae]|uniref:Uncharacterized protein n=1 Tax=Adineta ricciae TaxID=249248 RepID=A0A814W2Y4_ADIRI|nr:unnamed protein product [Adineta ricciae]